MIHPTLEIAERLVEGWKVRLGMHGWEIDLSVNSGRGDQNWSMRAFHQDNYERGSIEIHPRVIGRVEPEPASMNFDSDAHENPSKFERLIVHELLHLLFRRRDRARKRIADEVPLETKDAFNVLSEDADEEIIEQLARTLVKFSSIYADCCPQVPVEDIGVRLGFRPA